MPVAGVPNAAHLMHYLKAYGFDEIAINLHYLADAIVEALGDGSRFGVNSQYSYEPELLGSAGGVKKLGSSSRQRRSVFGCDEVTDIRLDKLLDVPSRSSRDRDDRSRRMRRRRSVRRSGPRRAREDRRLPGETAEGNRTQQLPTPASTCFRREIFDHIPPAEFYDFGKQVFPALQSAGEPFYGFHARGAYWADIGTPGEYRRASYDVVEGVVRIPKTTPNGIDSSARLGSNVRIEGPVRIGASATIADGVSIVGPSIIGDRVRVDAAATLERSILWNGARIGARANLRDTIVGTGYAVAPESVLDDALVAIEAST